MNRDLFTPRILIIFDAWVSCSFRIGEHVGAGLDVPRGLAEEHTRLDEDLWDVFQETYGTCTCETNVLCPGVELHSILYLRESDYFAAGRLAGEVTGRVTWEVPTPEWVELDSSMIYEDVDWVESSR
jgi:hypothetical protein